MKTVKRSEFYKNSSGIKKGNEEGVGNSAFFVLCHSLYVFSCDLFELRTR
jgi:hypothetical protein